MMPILPASSREEWLEPSPSMPATLRVGDVVDRRYELRRDLGRGAGALVFEAVHRYTGRSVALKVVGPGAPSRQLGELHARLLREGRALAAVRHPGIVEVLDSGLHEDRIPYLVMEKLEGRTLEGILAARGKISLEDTVAVGVQLAEALQAAHAAGVVHRDLKPGNIFIVRDRDGFERIKLVDFGIAQLRDPRQEKITGIGALIGTPAYMAPEQLLALGDVDGRADTYALGATLFECLAGRVPYEGSYQRVLLQVCGDGPRPQLQEAVSGASRALAAIVGRAIAKNREDRFTSAAEMGASIQAVLPDLQGTTLLGPPPPRAMRPRVPPPLPRKALPVEQRRRTPRAPYNTPVRVTTASGPVDGRTEDISEGGMLVITRQPCEANQRVSIRFALPIEGKVVSCAAHVRWVRVAHPGTEGGPSALGLEFVDPPAEMLASVARYVTLMGDGVSA